ncbi:GH25 family lysozyme [Actinacidiphila sp. ITFR-21]|uniref:GH25 family lysozyme n=1 Tax=Actinacidiphila sp. ITFR-21 TaxID=3075199 RepID=UPI00288AE131|nr:GH25 family lysozyme [Streptomyces sp. ITFR-21]WNI14449.1 GH25 family lysozyme [Streptomyces sp. ITFR-21]
MTVNGIDVASYQNTTYATAGLSFVIVKATEGAGYVNAKHAAQIATGRSHGLVVGHYHYAKAGPVAAQVAYFLKHAAPKAGDLLALDWEDADVSAADKDAWIKQAQAAAPGHRVLLYCNRDFWLHRDTTSFAGDGLWIADPGGAAGQPRVEHAWTIHQYSDSGGIDHDVANFTSKAALQAWARKGSPAPAYEPFPGADWFTAGRRSPVVAAMHARLVAVGCDHYTSSANKDVIGSGDVASYEAWQRKYNTDHHKGWSGAALEWPPGKETWDALKVPNT